MPTEVDPNRELVGWIRKVGMWVMGEGVQEYYQFLCNLCKRRWEAYDGKNSWPVYQDVLGTYGTKCCNCHITKGTEPFLLYRTPAREVGGETVQSRTEEVVLPTPGGQSVTYNFRYNPYLEYAEQTVTLRRRR